MLFRSHNLGFQLSYAAVLALRHLSTPLDHTMAKCWPARWLVPHRITAPLRAVRVAFSASLAAWMVSTPIVLFAFGSISPWCAVASTALGPLAALLTVIASLVVVIGWLPCVGAFLGAVLWLLGRAFLWGVCWVGTWPWCAVMLVGSVHPPTVPASLDPTVMEWIALDVGDGSAHIIRCADEVVVFDCGSISRNSVGSSVVVPALREMGVHRIHRLIISHPHLEIGRAHV